MLSKYHTSEEPSIGLTSLIDVVFLLLIFFMVSTTFSDQQNLDLRLPQSNSTELDENDIKVVVSIESDNSVYVQRGLKADPRKLVNNRPTTIAAGIGIVSNGLVDPEVVIRADRQSTHQTLVSVLDGIRQVGLSHVSFAAEPAQ